MHHRLTWTLGLYIGSFIIVFASCAGSKATSNTASSKKTTSTTKTATPAPSTASVAPALEDAILNLVNQHRKKKGLAPLEVNNVIEAEARRHTVSMATHKVSFGHSGFAYRSKVITTKITGITATAENVAYGSRTAEEVVTGWLNSPGHKKNIEGKFRLTGIGVARDNKSVLYFTQIFAN